MRRIGQKSVVSSKVRHEVENDQRIDGPEEETRAQSPTEALWKECQGET